MDRELEYPYRLRFSYALLGVFFFGAAALLFLDKAAGPPRGLIIDYVIRLDPDGAKIFYCCAAVLSFGIVLFGLGLFILGFTNPHSVRISAEGITAPKNVLASEPVWISFEDIQRVQRRKKGRHQSLVIAYRGDKLVLSRTMFPDNIAYETFIRALMEAMQERNPNIRYGYRQFV